MACCRLYSFLAGGMFNAGGMADMLVAIFIKLRMVADSDIAQIVNCGRGADFLLPQIFLVQELLNGR